MRPARSLLVTVSSLTQTLCAELDLVFSVPTGKHASYQVRNLKWHIDTVVFRKKLEPLPPLYETVKLSSA